MAPAPTLSDKLDAVDSFSIVAPSFDDVERAMYAVGDPLSGFAISLAMCVIGVVGAVCRYDVSIGHCDSVVCDQTA